MTSGYKTGNGADITEIKEIVKEFLSNYRYLHEFRIQKLMYFAELYTIDNYEQRLSDATWKPYMYGSFSEDVRTAVQRLEEGNEVDTETVRRDGSKTTKYIGYGISGGDISKAKKLIVNRVHQQFKSKSNDELGDESKESWLYQDQKFDTPMDFGKYLSYIRSVPKQERPYYDSDSPSLPKKDKKDLVKIPEDNGPNAEAGITN